MDKKITKKEKNKISLLKKIRQKTQELKEAIKRQKQKNAPFKLLVCVIKRNYSKDILSILNEREIPNHIVLFGQSYSDSRVAGVLGINAIEHDIVIAIAETKKTTGLINTLREFIDKETGDNEFACLIPPSSATLESLKFIISNYKKPRQL